MLVLQACKRSDGAHKDERRPLLLMYMWRDNSGVKVRKELRPSVSHCLVDIAQLFLFYAIFNSCYLGTAHRDHKLK